ncbi:MAG TPA: DUF1572 family protein [Vicinamibacterales bacterium]|nr:DUF1572 family protein [Vicinamibacterales bacterium]
MAIDEAYLADVREQFRKYKALADRALAQATDADLVRLIDPEANSLAILMQHIGGNLTSRFTDFLTTDGEKPDRHRDEEFEPGTATRTALNARWEEGWDTLFRSVDALTTTDLAREVFIRGERHSVVQALDRALTHLAYHVGQIVLLAKHFRGAEWTSLSIPRRR